jgi:hypothetical protein
VRVFPGHATRVKEIASASFQELGCKRYAYVIAA